MATKTPSRAVRKDTLTEIRDELRSLRRIVEGLYPQESLDEYAHPERIRRSYRKAARRHSPSAP